MKDLEENRNDGVPSPKGSIVHRHAVRAIIFVEDKLVMIQSQKYHEYKFPGGGVEQGEDPLHALKREVLEEAGVKITDSIQSFGYISESRPSSDHPHHNFNMRSDYYLCTIEESGLPQNLDEYEKKYDYRVVLISVVEALKHNEALSDEHIPWNRRECRMLRQLIAANIIKEQK